MSLLHVDVTLAIALSVSLACKLVLPRSEKGFRQSKLIQSLAVLATKSTPKIYSLTITQTIYIAYPEVITGECNIEETCSAMFLVP